jgi:hypothetical protein
MQGATEGPTFDDVLVTGAWWLLVGCACWSLLVCAAVTLEAATSGRLRASVWVGCPPSWRRALLAGLGVALATSPCHGAAASSGLRSRDPADHHRAASLPLPVPARPAGAARPQVVVGVGDSLWRLAQARLPDAAAHSDVAQLVDRLYSSNRTVIGPDADLIRPGQRLTVPTRLRPPVNQHLEENR